MTKHYKFELKIVQEYLKSSLNYRTLTEKYNLTSKRIIKRWINKIDIKIKTSNR